MLQSRFKLSDNQQRSEASSSFNPHEIDKVDYRQCPFNPSHYGMTKESQYLAHVIRCRSRGKNSNLVRCRHNRLHLFSDPMSLVYHEPRCESHPGRDELCVGEALICRFSNFHHIWTAEALSNHETNCPTSIQTPSKLAARSIELPAKRAKTATDEAFVGRSDVYALDEAPPHKHEKWEETELPIEEKLIVHLGGLSVQVLKLEVKQVSESHLYIEHFTTADKEHYPGFAELERTQTHRSYLAAYLLKDSPDSVKNYRQLKDYLTSKMPGLPQTPIAMCHQSAGTDNIVWLIVHKSEQTGFGRAVGVATLALFSVPSSFLYGKKDSKLNLVALLERTRSELAQAKRSNQQQSSFEANPISLQISESSEKPTQEKFPLQVPARSMRRTASPKPSPSLNVVLDEGDSRQVLLKAFFKHQKPTVHSPQTVDVSKQANTTERRGKGKETRHQQLAKPKTKQPEAHAFLLETAQLYKPAELAGVRLKASDNGSRELKPGVTLEAAVVRQTKPGVKLCSFCNERIRDVVNVPCGHVRHCIDCVQKHFKFKLNAKIPDNDLSKQCEECNQPIERVSYCSVYHDIAAYACSLTV